MAGRLWTRSETLAAFALYCETPFGRLHARNPQLIAVGARLGRTPASVAMKCCNLASLDESHLARGVKALGNASALDRAIWAEFQSDPEAVAFAAAEALAALDPTSAPPVTPEQMPPSGLERERVVRVRVNQYFFRRLVLASYEDACAICGLPLPDLLVAAHIVPWSIDPAQRMNPHNGLCLCGTHDLAFERGLIVVDRNYLITARVPSQMTSIRPVQDWLTGYDGRRIRLPQRWPPDPVLLARKYDMVS